jgi:DNA-binding CsgD family transcriptional regulator
MGAANGKTGAEALSHREHQVFRLLTTGHSVSEIGAQLGLAPNTVSTYRARILEKTGAKNDVELALYAERHAKAPPAG